MTHPWPLPGGGSDISNNQQPTINNQHRTLNLKTGTRNDHPPLIAPGRRNGIGNAEFGTRKVKGPSSEQPTTNNQHPWFSTALDRSEEAGRHRLWPKLRSSQHTA